MSARWRSFWLAEIGVSLILILVAIGLWLDWRAFVVNIVAGLAIVVVGVFVTFAVLDRLEAAFRRRRWERVRVLTVRSLCTHLSDIVNDFSAGLSKTLFSKGAFGMGRDRPDRTALEAFQSFLPRLRSTTLRSSMSTHKPIATRDPSTTSSAGTWV